MSFFLTDSQEDELNLFLDEQNRQACEEQLKSRLLPDDLSEIVKKSVEADTPLPAFDPIVGYIQFHLHHVVMVIEFMPIII